MLTGISRRRAPTSTAVLPGIVVFGLGLALTVAPLTTTALGAVDDRHAGVASGVNNAVARTGQLLAVAAIPVIAGFRAGEAVAADELLDGFDRVMRVAALVVVGAAAIAWTTVRRPARRRSPRRRGTARRPARPWRPSRRRAAGHADVVAPPHR